MMRCDTTTTAKQWMNSGNMTVRCSLEEGHEGHHQGWVQPFPGFANESVRWSDSDEDDPKPIGPLGEFEDRLQKGGKS